MSGSARAPRLASFLAVVLAGCGAARAPGLPPAPRPSLDGGAPASATLPEALGSYGPEPSVALAPVEAQALELARTRLSAGAPSRHSPALSLAARALARRAAGGHDVFGARPLRVALARALAPDPSPRVYRVRAAAAGIPDALADLLRPIGATHVGAGAVERDGAVHLVVLASERKARLDAFPRDVAPGAAAVLAGELARGLRAPRVLVIAPAGDVREADVAGTGAAFRARVVFPASGLYTVELLAQGEGGPEVAALLTVAVGGAALEDAARASVAPAPEPDGVASAEAAILRAIDALRRRRGLGAVVSDPELSAVARRHSEAMRAAGRIAHVLPGTPEIGERLRRAGVAYRFAYENVATGNTGTAAHEKIEESPAHLENLVRRGTTRVGVGLARGRLSSGDPIVYLTEILVEPADDGAETALTPEARVREALWRERARRGGPPLTADALLDGLARDAAESMRARDATDAEDLGARALAAGRRLSAVDVFVASAPAEAVRSANLPDPRFRRVGVGVAAGDSRRFGARRLYIAVVYTE
jgi:uncharacterized protein YkwD